MTQKRSPNICRPDWKQFPQNLTRRHEESYEQAFGMLGRYPRVTCVWRMGSITTYEENKVLKFAAFDVLTALPIADCDQNKLWNGLILQLNNYWPANQLAVWRRFILEYLFNFWTVCMLPFFGFVETFTVRTHFLGTISCGKSTKSFPANGHFSDDVKFAQYVLEKK